MRSWCKLKLSAGKRGHCGGLDKDLGPRNKLSFAGVERAKNPHGHEKTRCGRRCRMHRLQGGSMQSLVTFIKIRETYCEMSAKDKNPPQTHAKSHGAPPGWNCSPRSCVWRWISLSLFPPKQANKAARCQSSEISFGWNGFQVPEHG